jgi:DNA polymerase elongation subunit (family B)
MKWQPKVPLIVDTEQRRDGTEFLVWDGEPGRLVHHPRRPGFWSVTADGKVAESALKRRLSDTSAPPTLWHRLEFNTDAEAREYAAQRTKEGYATYLGDVDRYITRVVVEDPAFFLRYPMNRPLRILAVDVEQRTDGSGFPPRDAPIVSIALSYLGTENEKPDVTVAADDSNGEPLDGPCMEAWRRAIQSFDPDIIVGFNVGYDLGVLAARGAIHGYPLEAWGRFTAIGEQAVSKSRQESNGKFSDTVYYVGGRIVWDLRSNANAVSDYNLSGCKDFKLKTIAEFLGWPAIKEDTKNTLDLWRHRLSDLITYNANDTDLVRRMVERYLPDRLRMAEFFGAPLDMVIDVGSGWSGTVASARVLFNSGIVSDGTNLERHRKWVRTRAENEQFEDDDEEGLEDRDKTFIKFEGAIVNCPRPGLHKPIFKVDYASLYPSVVLAVGCGPDNTRIIATDPLGPFKTWRDAEALILSIPDRNYKHNWRIEVRGPSAFVDIVNKRTSERLAAKHGGDKTRANILKTMLNSMGFGVPGALHNRYGVWPIGIIAAGVSREMVTAIGRKVEATAIETDTDGIFLTEKPDMNAINAAANAAALVHGFKPRFEVELEDSKAGWFYKAKHYLLLEENEKGEDVLVRKGGSMKGRMHPAIFDRIIERVGMALLKHGRAAALLIARRCTDLKSYTPQDFIQRVTLHKEPEAYAHATKEVKVARAHNAAFGTPIKPGQSYEYVRTRDGLVPPTPENLAQLDEWAYLSRVIIPALERLGFNDLKELGLEDRASLAQARSKRPAKESSLAMFMR